MRVLIVDSYYDSFVAELYGRNIGLSGKNYSAQKRELMEACFGTSDFYSRNLAALGHPAEEVVATCVPLQQRWAVEHNVALNPQWLKLSDSARLPWSLRFRQRELARIVVAQAKKFQPDVIHFQDPGGTSEALLHSLRKHASFFTTQIAIRVEDFGAFKRFDLTLSSFPHYVERFRQAGVRSAYFNLGFEPRVLEHLRRGQRHDVVFVGGLSKRHSARTQWLEHLAQRVPLKWWGYGVETLDGASPLRASYKGEAWGLEMYNIFFNSRIVLNHHIDAAEKFANNMRLYEATGVGSLLLTDAKENLGSLFEVGREVVAYRDAEECASLVERYLANESEREVVAAAGQQRTLRTHTYRARMEEYVQLVSPLLK